jgi:hypothetical protein
MAWATFFKGLCLITALAVMLGALPFLRGGPLRHDPGVFATVHAKIHAGIANPIDHPPAHADHSDGGSAPNHHDYTAHSHLTLGLASQPASLIAPEGARLRVVERPCRGPINRPFPPDRPPCRATAA